jgi:hypothetical protein
MEYGSQKAACCLVLLMAGRLGAAELTYEVRHHRALKDHFGTLTVGEKGVSYQWKEQRVSFDYQDIQELSVSPEKLVVVTYKDRKWLLGVDKEFEFSLPKGKSFEAAYTMLHNRLDRRFVAALADSPGTVLWELPVKRLGTLRGSEGVLQVGADRIVYKTPRTGQSRTWRFEDIENVSTSDRYQLTLVTYERSPANYGSRKGFNFQLKRPLEEGRFEGLWRRLNLGHGIPVLSAIQ